MWTTRMLLLFLLITILASSAQQVNYVRPFNSANCAGHEPCLTIQEYLSAKSHLVSGAVFKFFPGNHSLQNYVPPVRKIAHVVLEGDSAVSITLTNTRVEFHDVTNLTIECLTFIINSGTNSSFVFNSSNISLTATRFLQNARNTLSGYWEIIHVQNSSVTIANCSFKIAGLGTLKYQGRAVYANNSIIQLAGNNSFIDNIGYNGGALRIALSVLKCEGNQVFVGNKATNYGGGIYLWKSDAYLRGASIHFEGNSANLGGAIYCYYSNLTAMAGELLFVGNSANLRGGGVRIINVYGQNRIMIAAALFVNNTALQGGAMHVSGSKNMTLKNLTAIGNSVTALSSTESDITFSQNTTFVKNDGTSGGAVSATDSKLSYSDYTLFRDNTANDGGAIYSKIRTAISLDGIAVFHNNTAKEDGGAICAVKGTHITLHGTVNFTSNSARNGGAMYFQGTTLTLVNDSQCPSNCSLNTAFNHASDYGGAIYFRDDTVTPSQCTKKNISNITDYFELIELPYCFLEFKNGNTYTNLASINFFNDTSSKTGNYLYGGMIDRCRMRTNPSTTLLRTPFFTTTTNQNNAVILKSFKLCFCDGSLSNVDMCASRTSSEVIRGQNLTLSLTAFDMNNRITAATIHAKIRGTMNAEDEKWQFELERELCSSLTHNLHPNRSTDDEVIQLYLDPCENEPSNFRATIHVHYLPCPNAFMLTSDGKCGCDNRLQELGAICAITEDNNHIISKDSSQFWMCIHNHDNGSYQGLITSKSCPFDYCNSSVLNITLDNLDTQCVQNRRGVLCGACATNYSLLLGSSACQECSNVNIALVFFLFVSGGLGLVFLLTVLRLTVATGMINSLIIYINVVYINRKSFLLNKLLVFRYIITWFNFNFSFKVCFYDGMDAYARTWLQFAFPLYVWILITLIIFASRYSMKISKWMGSNPVAVLATLLLMSYAKLLSIFIEVYSPASLDYPDNKTVTRWLSDANVPYMESKHLVLAVVTTLVLLFFFLPYTFLLLLGYKLYSYTDRKCFHWLLKIKPLLDSYYAPYKSHTRYWTGFLLLVRCVLYIVFAFDPLGEKNQSLLAFLITFAIIGVYFALGRVYTNFYTNVIEASIYLNLTILSAATLAKVNSPQLCYTLVGIFLLTMAGIIVYHFHLNCIASSKLWHKTKAKFISLKKAVLKSESSRQDRTNESLSLTTVTQTVISLRESLLENSSDIS